MRRGAPRARALQAARAWPRPSTGPRPWPRSAGPTSTRPRSAPPSARSLKYREDQKRVRDHGLGDLDPPGRRCAVPDAEVAAGARAGRRGVRPGPAGGRAATSPSTASWPSPGLGGRGLRRPQRSSTGPGGRPSCTAPRTSASTTRLRRRSSAATSSSPPGPPEPPPVAVPARGRRRRGRSGRRGRRRRRGPARSHVVRCQPDRGAAPQGLRRLHRRRAGRGQPPDGRPALWPAPCGRSRRRRPTSAAPGPARPAPHGPGGAAHRGRGHRPAPAATAGEPASAARPAGRRVRLDGALRPGPAALRPRRSWPAAPGSRRSPSAPA